MEEKVKSKKGKLYVFASVMQIITNVFKVFMIISLIAVSIALLASPIYLKEMEKRDPEQYVKELQEQLKNYSITVKNEANSEENYEIKGNELSEVLSGKDMSEVDAKAMVKNFKKLLITVLIGALVIIVFILLIANKFIEFFKNIKKSEEENTDIVSLENANVLKAISKRMLIFIVVQFVIQVIYALLFEFKSFSLGITLEPIYILIFIYMIALIFEKEAKKRDTVIEEEVIKEEVVEENN